MKPMEEMLVMMAVGTNPIQDRPKGPKPPSPPPPSALGAADALNPAAAAGAPARTERLAPPQKEKAHHCPRCSSTDTKFCYYNHYSLQTPRYWCKACRRYWTEGGSLRKVPVGGGCRKNKRRSSSTAAPPAAAVGAASTTTAVSSGSGTVVVPVGLGARNPNLMRDEGAHDLKLALPHRHGLPPPEFAAFPSLEGGGACNPGATTTVAGNGVFSAMELLRSTGCGYVPLQDVQLGMRPTEYAAAGLFALGEFRMPTTPPPPFLSQSVLGLSVDTHGTEGYNSTGWQGVQENAAGRLLFPFEDLRPAVSAAGATNPRADQYEQDEGGSTVVTTPLA